MEGSSLTKRGLDRHQRELRERTKEKILIFLHQNEPANSRKIIKKAGLSDGDAVRMGLKELRKTKKISSLRFENISSLRKGTYHYTNPASSKINDLLDEEREYKGLNLKKYDIGIREKIPVHIQYKHKLRILREQLTKNPPVSKKVRKDKVGSYSKFIDPIQKFLTNSSLDEQFEMFEKDFSTDISGLPPSMQFLLIDYLDAMAIYYKVKRDFNSLSYFTDYEKLQMGKMLMEYNIGYVAKYFGCSRNVVSKLKRRFFDSSEHLKKEIDEIHDKLYGEKRYPMIEKDFDGLKDWFKPRKFNPRKFKELVEAARHVISPVRYVSYREYLESLPKNND